MLFTQKIDFFLSFNFYEKYAAMFIEESISVSVCS